MSFETIEYYKALTGESSLQRNTWHINHNKRHIFCIFSDYDAINPSFEIVSVPPSNSQTRIINSFSNQFSQKLDNTKIVSNFDGTEEVHLQLEDRIVTMVIDQSGSMTWNDNENLRHELAKDIAEKITLNYPGNVKYNLYEYGSKLVNVLFFGVLEEEGINPYDINTLSKMFLADDNANYAGIRVSRKIGEYPSAVGGIDGDIIKEGFMSGVLDEEVESGETYYYKIYTYDKNWKFSEGVKIKISPKERIIPRGVSIFKTPQQGDDLTVGLPFIGRGLNKDSNTIGIWHMDETKGDILFDFSNSNLNLNWYGDSPVWLPNIHVPCGISGLYFNGTNNYAFNNNANGDFIFDFSNNNCKCAITAWIMPYDVSENFILSRGDEANINYAFGIYGGKLYFQVGATSVSSTNDVDMHKWQHVAIVYDKSESGNEVSFYINGVFSSHSFSVSTSGSYGQGLYVGQLSDKTGLFYGKMSEVTLHNLNRDQSYILSQLIEENITVDEEIVGTDILGIREDNGDRLVVLEVEIPEDYNFPGGEIIIVKNEQHIPTWEEDGSILYNEAAVPGKIFVSDSDEFVLSDTYYYRVFSKNVYGNVSFLEDSPYLKIYITPSLTTDYFSPLLSEISSPISPTHGELVTPGNKKVYLRVGQLNPFDDRIKRVRIYYSDSYYPFVNKNGGHGGVLIYSGTTDGTDIKFVHKDIQNDVTAYYTIVNIDKYGRPSNYDAEGNQISNFLQASCVPSDDADESVIPLPDVENITYELINSNAVSIMWDQPLKSPSNISAYFDQTVLLYASITDVFGSEISDSTLIKMYINANIERNIQAINVFESGDLLEFQDKDSYNFVVTRTDSGFLKGSLNMTSDRKIISQIKQATFTIQLKSYIPKNGYIPQDQISSNENDSLKEYAQTIQGLIDDIEETPENTVSSSENIFEFYSEPITVLFTNPWEIDLENRDNKKVPQRCYVQITDPITKDKRLSVKTEFFNGIYMKASDPFVVRAKLKYKGEPIESGNVQISVWDADSSNLCANASANVSDPHEGNSIQVSSTVRPPSNVLPVIRGTEDREGLDSPMSISYVDIPLYAPNLSQAVRLYVKGDKAGYSSVQSMYILFQSILKIDINARAPEVDGKDTAEQVCNVYIVNPDFPEDNSYNTRPDDNTIVQWGIKAIQGNHIRSIYSIDNVPVANGIYSYIRNGYARNVFLGPIPRSGEENEETHEISAIVVYKGMTSFAKSYIYIEEHVTEYSKFNAKFLMEIDGGYKKYSKNYYKWGGGGWKLPASYPLWTDGQHYKRIKIHRNPQIATQSEFASADCFRNCASSNNYELLELNSGQIINVITNDDDIEILHGEIYEQIDPYTGESSLIVGENGFIDRGNAFIELEDEQVSDITYFYIRANKFIPMSGPALYNDCDDDRQINKCLCLGKNQSEGLTECELPEWSPYITIAGKTTVFVNNQPLILSGGGDYYTGIPPCPICLLEPLTLHTKWMRIRNYYYSLEYGDPSNNYIYEKIIEVGNNSFIDEDGKSLVQYNSDIEIRVEVAWKGDIVPEGTPIYISIGKNTGNTTFIASRNIYYTKNDTVENYSYVDVKISPQKIVSKTTTEKVEIYCTYDKNEKTERKRSIIFNLTMDKKEGLTDYPDYPIPDPSIPLEEIELTPFSSLLHRYDIIANKWTKLTGMDEERGNLFGGIVGNYIYAMGGLKNNSLNISNRNERYDIYLDIWVDMEPLPVAKFAGMSITIDNDIYIIGGISRDDEIGGSLSVDNRVDVYHAETDSWEEKTSMPIIDQGSAFEDKLGVAFGTAIHAVINGKNYIYILGGVKEVVINSSIFSIRKYNDRILRYCIEDDNWEYSSILRSNELSTYQRISPLSLFYDDKIIIFGGAVESNNIFIYPPDDFYIEISENLYSASGEFIIFSSGLFKNIPVPKFQSAFTMHPFNPSSDMYDYYILGGWNNDSSNLDIVEKITVSDTLFDYNSSYDENPSIALDAMLKGRHGAFAVSSNIDGIPSVYVFGGYTAGTTDNHLDISFDI